MSDLFTYLWDVGAAWLGGFWFVTALPDVADRLMTPARFKRVNDWLNSQLDAESRRRLFVWIAVIGIFFAISQHGTSNIN
jgi:hypothetical protein